MNKVKTRFCDTVEGRECCRGAGRVGRGEAAALSGGWGPQHCLGLPPAPHCATSPSVSGPLVPLVCGALFSLPGVPFPPGPGPVIACIFPESRPSILLLLEHRPLQDAP